MSRPRSRFNTKKHTVKEAKIEQRLRHWDAKAQLDADWVPCWCHGRWYVWDTWKGLTKRRRRR